MHVIVVDNQSSPFSRYCKKHSRDLKVFLGIGFIFLKIEIFIS